MVTVIFKCGCSVSKSMFADNTIMFVHHCEEHSHLFSDNKTLRRMAKEIYAVCSPKEKEDD